MYIYHSCSYPLWVDSVRQNSVFITEYYDPKVKERPEKISVCPCCNEPLGKVFKKDLNSSFLSANN